MFLAGGVDTLPRTQYERGLAMEVGVANAVAGTGISAGATTYLEPTSLAALTKLNDAKCDSSRRSSARVATTNIDLEATALARMGTRNVNQLFSSASQGATNMCTSMAMTHAYALRYALTQPIVNGSGLDARVPQLSATYAYYFQRVQECRDVRVCVCRTCAAVPSCKDDCEPPCVDCGSYLQSAGAVFETGVALADVWPASRGMDTPPSAEARANAALYRVTALACVPIAASAFHAALVDGFPIAAFLNLTPTQTAWMAAQTHAVATTPQQLVMPAYSVAANARTTVVGHVVMLDGFDAGARVFLARNNYGNTWGVDGRFAIALDQVTTLQFHTALAVRSVVGAVAADDGK
jgi:hypothetical protein